MPSRPATNQSDGRLKQNRAPSKVERKTPKKVRPRTVKGHVNERMQALLDGKISVTDLSNEELAKGRCYGPNGKFGKQSAVIPAKFYNEAIAEFKRRMEAKFQEDVEPMRKILQEMASNPRISADARYKSAVYLMDRAIGKVAEKTEATVEVKKWEGALGEVFLEMDEEASNGKSE